MSDVQAIKQGLVIYDFLTYKSQSRKKLSDKTAKNTKKQGMVLKAIEGGLTKEEKALFMELKELVSDYDNDNDLNKAYKKLDTYITFNDNSKDKIKEALVIYDYLCYKSQSRKKLSKKTAKNTKKQGMVLKAIDQGLSGSGYALVKELGKENLLDYDSDADLDKLINNEKYLTKKLCKKDDKYCTDEMKKVKEGKTKSEAVKQKAEKKYEEAEDLYEKQSYEQATGLYKKAYGIYKDPKYMVGQAKCYRALKQYDKAKAVYQNIQKIYPDYNSSLVATMIESCEESVLDDADEVQFLAQEKLSGMLNSKIGKTFAGDINGPIYLHVCLKKGENHLLLGTSESKDWVEFGEKFSMEFDNAVKTISREEAEVEFIEQLINKVFMDTGIYIGENRIKKDLYFEVKIEKVSMGDTRVYFIEKLPPKKVKALKKKKGLKFEKITGNTKIYKYNVKPSASEALKDIKGKLFNIMGLDKKKLSKEEKETKIAVEGLLKVIYEDPKLSGFLKPENLKVLFDLVAWLAENKLDRLKEYTAANNVVELKDLVDFNLKYAYEEHCKKIFYLSASGKKLDDVLANQKKYHELKVLYKQYDKTAKALGLHLMPVSYDKVSIEDIMKGKEKDFKWLIPYRLVSQKFDEIGKLEDDTEKLKALQKEIKGIVLDINTIHGLGEKVESLAGKYRKLWTLINGIKITKENVNTAKDILKKLEGDLFKDIRELLEKKIKEAK